MLIIVFYINILIYRNTNRDALVKQLKRIIEMYNVKDTIIKSKMTYLIYNYYNAHIQKVS